MFIRDILCGEATRPPWHDYLAILSMQNTATAAAIVVSCDTAAAVLQQ